MKSRKFRYSIIATSLGVALLCVSIKNQAQQLQIKNTQIKDGRVVLTYHISDTTAGKYFTVRAYSSHDNYMQPLERIAGDAGILIRPGSDRTLSWDPKELGDTFNGKVALEIRARVYVPFVKLDGFETGTQVKRLKPYTLSWSGGSPQNILNIDLLRKGEKETTFANIANVGHYSLVLPKHIKPGKYVMRISDSKNKDEVVISNEFRVRRKYPLLLKIIPFVGITALTAWLLKPEDTIVDPILPE
jgi:hypothetical protein